MQGAEPQESQGSNLLCHPVRLSRKAVSCRLPAAPNVPPPCPAPPRRLLYSSAPSLPLPPPLQAIPIMNEALAALDTIKEADITYIKKLGNPPAAIKLVLEAVCVILDAKPAKVGGVVVVWGPSAPLSPPLILILCCPPAFTAAHGPSCASRAGEGRER